MTFALYTGPSEVSALRAYLNQLVNYINSPSAAFPDNVEIVGDLTVDGTTTLSGAITATAALVDSVTVSSAAMGTTRVITGNVTASNAAIASGTAVGVRGTATLSGVISAAGGPFVIGNQGKLFVTGTMNHADSRLAAMFAQLDTTGATLTTGQISALWVDHGAGITGAGGGQFNMVRITNTVAGSKPNGVVYAYSDATYLLDLGAPSASISYITSAGAGSIGANPVKIAINVNGSTKYLIAADDWT